MTAPPLIFDFTSLAAHLDGRLDKLEAKLNKRLDAQDAKFGELQEDIRKLTKEYFDPSDDETDGDNLSSASEPDEDLDDDDDDDDDSEASDDDEPDAAEKKEKKTKSSNAPLVHPDDAEEAAELQEQLTNMMSGIRKSPLATALPQATAAAKGKPTGGMPSGSGPGTAEEDDEEEPRIVEEDMEVNDVENFAAEYIDDDGEPLAERRARVAAWQKEKAELDKEELAQKALKQAKAEAEAAKAMSKARAGTKYWENSKEREAQRAPRGPYRPHFPEGTSMQIVGLKSRSELNGSEGTLVSFDTHKARWTVTLDATGEQIMVKEDNLTLLGGGVELPAHDFEVDDLVAKAMGNMKGTVPDMPDPD